MALHPFTIECGMDGESVESQRSMERVSFRKGNDIGGFYRQAQKGHH